MQIPEQVIRHWRIIKELENQTDRGVAIIGAAYLEERLAEALMSYFSDKIKNKVTINKNRETVEKRIFRGYGPLTTFSGKIDLGFALGFYGEKSLADFHVIRDIRNDFAHTVDPVSFTSQAIKSKCNKLWYPAHYVPIGKDKLPSDPKDKFLEGVFMLWNFLWTEMVKKRLVGSEKKARPRPYCMK